MAEATPKRGLMGKRDHCGRRPEQTRTAYHVAVHVALYRDHGASPSDAEDVARHAEPT
jgi:hypothetical protein